LLAAAQFLQGEGMNNCTCSQFSRSLGERRFIRQLKELALPRLQLLHKHKWAHKRAVLAKLLRRY